MTCAQTADSTAHPSPELSCLEELQQQTAHILSSVAYSPGCLLLFACIAHTSETHLTLVTKQGADMFSFLF